MALNASGPISIGGSTTGQSINLELRRSATATTSLNDAVVRTLLVVGSNENVPMDAAHGKSATVLSYATMTAATLGGYYGWAAASYPFGGNWGQLSVVPWIVGGHEVSEVVTLPGNSPVKYAVAVMAAVGTHTGTLTIDGRNIPQSNLPYELSSPVMTIFYFQETNPATPVFTVGSQYVIGFSI